jgi:hypothetical protein
MTRRLNQLELELLRMFAEAPGNRICPGEGFSPNAAGRKMIRGLVGRGDLLEEVYDDGPVWTLTAQGMVEVDNG